MFRNILRKIKWYEEKDSMKKKTISFATIGTSKIADGFICMAKKCNDFSLEAVYSRDWERANEFAEKYGAVKCYDKLEQLALDSNVDAVYIASPNSKHFHQAIMLMNAGKHILCEKALGSNKREVELMLQAAKDNQVILLEATCSLFDPGFDTIKENLDKIGKIRRATFRFCQRSSRYDSFLAGNQHNIFDVKFAAGALMDIGIYCVQPLIELFGEPLSVNAESIMLRGGIDGAGTILASYEGMLAELIYSKITNSKIPSEIQGESGIMQINSISSPREVTIIFHEGMEQMLKIEQCDNNMCYELAKFIQAVHGEVNIDSYNKVSLDSLKLMDRVRDKCGITFLADN